MTQQLNERLWAEARRMWTLAAATLERDVLLHGLTSDEQDVMIGAVLNAAERTIVPAVHDKSMVEKVARAIYESMFVDSWTGDCGIEANQFRQMARDAIQAMSLYGETTSPAS